LANNRKCLRFDPRLSVEEAERLGLCEKCKVFLCMLLEGGGPSDEEREHMEREDKAFEDMLA